MNKYLELFKKIQSTAPLTKNSKILIIDGTNTYIRVFCNVPALNDNGDHVGGVVGFLKSVGALIRKEAPTRCFIVFDGKGGSQRRRQLFPEYKSKRKNAARFNRFEEFRSIEDEKESLRRQANRIIKYLDCLPVTTISIDNIEADDTIAYLTNYFTEHHNSKVIISSADRDFIQLVSNNVTVWSPIKKIYYDPEQIQKEFGLFPTNYLIYRVMTGDSSDGIPGIQGIGLKTILNRFPEVSSEHISLEYLIKKSQENALNHPKIKIFQTIVENKNNLELNHKLMQLQTSIISGNSTMVILKKIDEVLTTNRKEFLRLFLEDGLYTMIKDPHSWLRDTFNKLEFYSKQWAIN